MSVVDITSSTAHKRTKKQASQRRKLHREKFVIPMTHKDNVNSIASSGINVLLDPKEVIGSCQFEAISHQLSLFGIHRTPLALRQEAVEHLENHFELYLNFIPGEVVFDKLQYIQNMKNEHTFGDHVTLLAVSRCYNVQILIASPASLDHTVLVSPDGKYRPDNFLLTLGHFPDEKGEHYISVGMCADKKKELLFHATYDGRSGSDDRDQTGRDDRDQTGRDQTGNGHNGQTGRYDRDQIDSDDRDHFESDVADHVDSDDREQFNSDDRDQTGRDERDKTGRNERDKTGRDDRNQTGRDDRDQTGRDDRDQTGRDDRDQTGNGPTDKLADMTETRLTAMTETTLKVMSQTMLTAMTESSLTAMIETRLAEMRETKLAEMRETKLAEMTETRLAEMTDTRLAMATTKNIFPGKSKK